MSARHQFVSEYLDEKFAKGSSQGDNKWFCRHRTILFCPKNSGKTRAAVAYLEGGYKKGLKSWRLIDQPTAEGLFSYATCSDSDEAFIALVTVANEEEKRRWTNAFAADGRKIKLKTFVRKLIVVPPSKATFAATNLHPFASQWVAYCHDSLPHQYKVSETVVPSSSATTGSQNPKALFAVSAVDPGTVIKLVLDEEVRRIRVHKKPEEVAMIDVVPIVINIWSELRFDQFQYVDEEGDNCIVTTTSELREAFRWARKVRKDSIFINV